MTRLQRYLSDEAGTATIEFLFIFPIVMTIFLASFECSLFMIRNVMLERSVDIVVRDIRLGNHDGTTHQELKRVICETSALVGSVDTCVDSMMIWMQPVNTANFDMLAPPRHCVDRDEDISTDEPEGSEFAYGSDNDIMLMRICLKEEPLFPTTIVGAGLIAGGEGDGSYALTTTTVFVNEPG